MDYLGKQFLLKILSPTQKQQKKTFFFTYAQEMHTLLLIIFFSEFDIK